MFGWLGGGSAAWAGTHTVHGLMCVGEYLAEATTRPTQRTVACRTRQRRRYVLGRLGIVEICSVVLSGVVVVEERASAAPYICGGGGWNLVETRANVPEPEKCAQEQGNSGGIHYVDLGE